MSVSLKWVVLGMVVERPGYGWDIRHRIMDRLPGVELSDSAVYPALGRLEHARLIVPTGKEASPDDVPRGNPRIIYQKTEAGIERFQRWMYAASSPTAFRDELTAKLAFASPRNMPRLIEITHAQEDQLRRELHALVAPPPDVWTRGGKIPWPIKAAMLARSREAKRIAAAIEWLEELRDELERELDPPVGRFRLPPSP
jgi:DNA-binding PadR family transcriptional regulator